MIVPNTRSKKNLYFHNLQETVNQRKTSAVETSTVTVTGRTDSVLQAAVSDETKHLEQVQVLDQGLGQDQTAKAQLKKTIKITTSVSTKQPHLEGVSECFRF